MILENIFNGQTIHNVISNCPLTSVAMIYKRVGHILTAFLCFKWIGYLANMMPISKSGALTWVFRGAVLPIIMIEYAVISDIFDHLLKDSSFKTVIKKLLE